MEEDERTIRWFGRFESEHFFFIVASLFLIVLASIHIVHFLVNAVLRATRKQHRVIYQFEGFWTRVFATVVSMSVLGLAYAVVIIWPPASADNWTYYFQVPFESAWWWVIFSWLGVGIACWDTIFFICVHIELGLMWTGAITRLENHQLKTSGPYMIARHPLYLSLIIAVLCIFLMTGNSILTFGFGIFVAFSVVRYRKEERLLIQMFGDEYRRYMRRVGPFWPNLCAKEDIEFNVEARESSPLVLEPAAPARLDVSS